MLILSSGPFSDLQKTFLMMIKSVAAVQKLTGTGLRLNLIQYQPTLSTSIMKNSFSTTRNELNKDTDDGLGNKLKEGVPFKSYVKNSENLDHFAQSQSPRFEYIKIKIAFLIRTLNVDLLRALMTVT